MGGWGGGWGGEAVLVDYEADEDARGETADGCEGEGGAGETDAYAGDESGLIYQSSGPCLETDNSGHVQHDLNPLPQHRDKRQQEHRILLSPPLHAALDRQTQILLLVEHLCDLDAPLILQLADAQEGGAHDADDERGEDGEDALPDVLCGVEGVAAGGVEGADDAAADGEADEDAQAYAPPDLE